MCFRGMRETDVFIPPKNEIFFARIYMRSLPYGGIIHFRFEGTGRVRVHLSHLAPPAVYLIHAYCMHPSIPCQVKSLRTRIYEN